MNETEAAVGFAQANRPRFVRELMEFLRFPSVSGDPAHARDLAACAEWLATQLRRAGLSEVELLSTPGNPIVYGAWRGARGGRTLLIYGHYDVQPVDPLSEWRSPPFVPMIRGGDLYARGASDDKGQLFVHVKAIESYLRTGGRLPVNVVCLFEGEEEIGSQNLQILLSRRLPATAADVAVISDMPIRAPDRPAITYGARGSISLEIDVFGPAHDLHSGLFGGAIHNPLQALCEILSQLHDRAGRIAVPGFYDGVTEWGQDERRQFASVGPSDGEFRKNAGQRTGWGEAGFSLHERTTIRPALIINGIVGGYQGPGIKAVIPARATAKLNIRLVPHQDPKEIVRRLEQRLATLTPPTVRSAARVLSLSRPFLMDRRHPALLAAARAYARGFGRSPVLQMMGGTIPIAATFQELLGLPTVMMGFALPDDGMHAPNEKFHLPNFFRGITASIAFLAELAGGSHRRQSSLELRGALSSDPRTGGVLV